MAKIISTKVHNSGIALGGIGTGSVELFPDGEFHYWQIANPPRLTTVCKGEKVDDGEGSTGALSFWVRACKKGQRPVVRKLGMRTEPEDFRYRMFPWNKPVEKIEFDGRFPVCDLNYADGALPCKVSMRAVSPFVPHQTDVSATPGFFLEFTLRNPTDEELEVSLLGELDPDFANKEEGFVNSCEHFGDAVGIYLQPEQVSEAPDCGNLCFSLAGDVEKSYITADYRRFFKEYIIHTSFGAPQESFLYGFREKGVLPDSDAGCRPAEIPEDLSALTDLEVDEMFELHLQYPFGDSLYTRIRHLYPRFPESRADKERFLADCRKLRKTKLGEAFGTCALCGKIKLAAGETKSMRFVLTWYFPNHFSVYGKKLGHYYEDLFADAKEANAFLVQNSWIFERAKGFSDLLYQTDLPQVYPDAWSSNLSLLVKCSWFLKDGKFGLWEGLGFCGFHTTDITYHASFGLLALFPELQKRQMRMGAAFQREDGRVHHFFTPDLEHVDDEFHRVDMNMQFVMMVLRDYLFTGDREYLSELWDNVVRAMDSIEKLDCDGDGLPDTETKRNTYDAWNFSGTPAYISVLWLAALKAAAQIAEIMEDAQRNAYWNGLLEKGKQSLEEKLWNGAYYDLWRDETCADESLMSDQLDGEWFLRMIGLGGNLPDEKVRGIVSLIFSHNFDADNGLVNATCPDGKKTSVYTWKNCQTEAIWTGIGYVFAALALSVGLADIAECEMTSIHENQMRLGAFWDHWECGHHYTRPMASWTTLIAALGLKVDSQARRICLHPVRSDITLPLCLCDVLATVTFKNGNYTINCLEGDLNEWQIFSDI